MSFKMIFVSTLAVFFLVPLVICGQNEETEISDEQKSRLVKVINLDDDNLDLNNIDKFVNFDTIVIMGTTTSNGGEKTNATAIEEEHPTVVHMRTNPETQPIGGTYTIQELIPIDENSYSIEERNPFEGIFPIQEENEPPNTNNSFEAMFPIKINDSVGGETNPFEEIFSFKESDTTANPLEEIFPFEEMNVTTMNPLEEILPFEETNATTANPLEEIFPFGEMNSTVNPLEEIFHIKENDSVGDETNPFEGTFPPLEEMNVTEVTDPSGATYKNTEAYYRSEETFQLNGKTYTLVDEAYSNEETITRGQTSSSWSSEEEPCSGEDAFSEEEEELFSEEEMPSEEDAYSYKDEETSTDDADLDKSLSDIAQDLMEEMLKPIKDFFNAVMQFLGITFTV